MKYPRRAQTDTQRRFQSRTTTVAAGDGRHLTAFVTTSISNLDVFRPRQPRTADAAEMILLN